MSAAVIFTGPEPPPGREFCFVCAFSAKAWANGHYARQIADAERADGSSPPVRLVIPEPLPVPVLPDGHLQLAVAHGVYPPLAQFGVQALCWSHLGGIQVTGLIPGQSGMMPPPPQGGVPLLGQGR